MPKLYCLGRDNMQMAGSQPCLGELHSKSTGEHSPAAYGGWDRMLTTRYTYNMLAEDQWELMRESQDSRCEAVALVCLDGAPSSISGKPVRSSTRRTSTPAASIAAALPPVDTSSNPNPASLCSSPHTPAYQAAPMCSACSRDDKDGAGRTAA